MSYKTFDNIDGVNLLKIRWKYQWIESHIHKNMEWISW